MKQVELQDGASADIVQENVQHLKELFPDAFTENGVNFDTLRQLLGDLKVLDEGEEKYGLNWHGKKQARQIALTPSLGTLLPCPEESVDWDTTQNLFIEGDNLEVLKLLQKSYASKVKMIYIDPPYNTGKEFVYPDKFQDNLDTYLKYTGQKGDEGLKFSSNTETGGRKHTNWLNMMYPRLKLAKSLLRDDGVIFISIDDNEQANLKGICDEIFGEENSLSDLIWNLSSGTQAGHFTRSHEYILAYTKNRESLDYFKDLSGGTIKHGALKKISAANPASEVAFSKGSIEFEGSDAEFPDELGNSEKQYITEGKLKFKNGMLAQDVTIKAGWAMKNQLLSWLAGKETFDSKGQKVIRFYFNSQGILFYEKERGTAHPKTVLPFEVGNTKKGSEEIIDLFGEKLMDFPKPTTLMAFLIKHVSQNNQDIVLDFFAGSGSTAHAVMNTNSQDGFSRKHITVQLPEKIHEDNAAFKHGYKTISDLAKERIRRAAKKIKGENPDYEGDLGFKVFKLASSNIKVWNPDRTDLEGSLLDHKEHLVEGRSEQDILYELLLKRGVDLTTPIETREIAGKNVYSIGFGKIITCLDDLIAANDVEPLASGIIAWQKELKDTLGVKVLETHVFFKDSAFRDDVAKTNMAAILSQNGIDHVRSL